MMGKACRRICLFDMDGTLTHTRKAIDADMSDLLLDLQREMPIGLISGSDMKSVERQLGHELLQKFEYVFVENGMVAYRKGEIIAEKSITEQIEEETLQKVIDFVLHYLADLHLPVKRGCFVEFRKGMINISPMGRSITNTPEDRRIFCEYDKEHKVREKMVQTLRNKFPDSGLTFSIGGQTSFDVFPTGWDKTFCLQYLEHKFDHIYFFGDRITEGENDFEIYNDPRTVGYAVTSPKHTKHLLRQLFLTDSQTEGVHLDGNSGCH